MGRHESGGGMGIGTATISGNNYKREHTDPKNAANYWHEEYENKKLRWKVGGGVACGQE